MSGPIVPPLEVTEVDGSPDGRPITKIVVSNGDLTVSGRTATIDTTGSGGTPAGSDTEIQFNDGGAFGGDAGFTMSIEGGGTTTVTQTGNILTGGNKLSTAVINGTVSIMSEGTGQLILRGHEDHGGTWTDSIVNIMSNANTDEAQLKFRDDVNIDNGSITLDGSGHMILNNNVAAKDIDLKVLTTGQVEIANQTTNTESVLSIMGNGTGDAKIDLQNASERVWVLMDENKKLKIQGGSGGNTWVFDASSATGGVTFPDGTEQITAASGGGGAVVLAGTPNTEFPAAIRYQQLGNCQPFGGGTTSYSWTSDYGYNQYPNFMPFVAAAGGDITSMSIRNNSSIASSNMRVGIYDLNSEGNPGSLLGYGDFDTSSSGVITLTSFSSTITTVRGNVYWLGIVKTTATTSVSLRGYSNSFGGLGEIAEIDGSYGTMLQNTSTNAGVLADPPSLSNLTTIYMHRLGCSLGWE